MTIQENVSLLGRNTFHINVRARVWAEYTLYLKHLLSILCCCYIVLIVALFVEIPVVGSRCIVRVEQLM